MARELKYSVMDVFAERPLEGNPLAVFHDGRSLTDDEMQALARETNLSETTFVMPGDNPEEERRNGVRVRIFTAQEELPFAGHPTLGTASWLHLHHPALRGAETMTLRLNVGPIEVRFEQPTEMAHGVLATMLQHDPVFGAMQDGAEVAAVIGMSVDDLLPGYAPQIVSTANPFCIVALRSVEALSRLAIPQREAMAWLRKQEARWFYCIAPVGENGQQSQSWRARMQWYSGEDPATGSAAGPCVAWLVKHGFVASGQPVTIEQGIEIRRPSRITAQATLENGEVRSVMVSGRTIPVASGAFSCFDKQDSHRAGTTNANSHARSRCGGGCAMPKFEQFRLNFAIVMEGSHG